MDFKSILEIVGGIEKINTPFEILESISLHQVVVFETVDVRDPSFAMAEGIPNNISVTIPSFGNSDTAVVENTFLGSCCISNVDSF